MWRAVARTDPARNTGFESSNIWKQADLNMFQMTPVDRSNPNSKKVAPSFSGGERNRMFLQRDGNFADVSLVSGADFKQDGRGFAIFDFDRDGYLDLAVTSPTEPRLRILRNTLGDNVATDGNHFVKVQLVGGNKSSESSSDLSTVDACGAKLEVTINGTTRAFQKSCGEGLASQNSSWIHIGLSDAKQIDSIKVTWPSQKISVVENVTAGKWLTISESPDSGTN